MNENVKKWAPVVSRYLLGLLFFMSGITGLLQLVPPPPDMPPELAQFMAGLMVTKYFIPLLKITETVCGLLLLGRYAPSLSLVILAPITINIIFVHLFLTPGLSEFILPFVILVMHLIAVIPYWPKYKVLFARD